MISRYERQNDDSFSFLKQQLDRIESRPQFSLCIQFLNHPRGWFQIGCIKILSVNWIGNPEGNEFESTGMVSNRLYQNLVRQLDLKSGGKRCI